MWLIDRQFNFCYGHRVWSQELIEEYCESGDVSCKCRHLHGHEGLVHVFLQGQELQRGMVTDFKHLGWLKDFLNSHLDHKFVLDLNDPWFSHIINGSAESTDGQLSAIVPDRPLVSNGMERIRAVPICVAGTDHLAGYALDVEAMQGPEREFYEGFFIVNFLPTSEHLSRWLFECVQTKMSLIDVKVKRLDWFETPRSRASYSADD